MEKARPTKSKKQAPRSTKRSRNPEKAASSQMHTPLTPNKPQTVPSKRGHIFQNCFGSMQTCILAEGKHECAHCSRCGATYICNYCNKEYHNCCLVERFRMYGLCECGMPLMLKNLRETAMTCCYCKLALEDFEIVLSCGHGACKKCWESFRLRKQFICALCGAPAGEI